LTQPIHAVVLAAGQGKRMRSRLPKVLHPLGGQPLLAWVLVAARSVADRTSVVVGADGEAVTAALAEDVTTAVQPEQLGTGHAVECALQAVRDDARVLVLYGDVPLITPATLQALLERTPAEGIGLITAVLDDPTGLGRVLRDAHGAVRGVVEERDADATQRAIREINSGILVAPGRLLERWLPSVGADNDQGERYLTDVFARAVHEGISVTALAAPDPLEVFGVNDRSHLAMLERVVQRRRANALMCEGVTVADPDRIDIRGELTAGRDSFLDVGLVCEGSVRLGEGVRVGPHCLLRDVEIDDDAVIEGHTVIDGARVGRGCSVGPFARLRPGSELGDQARVGNFVETKKARLGAGSKANHLAYLGDVMLGADCNVGAGTITCNYDGVDKHETAIGDRVFIGSNTTLVAPVGLAEDAFVAAGSTVTRAVPEGALAVGRSRQRNIAGWVHPARRDARRVERDHRGGSSAEGDPNASEGS